MAMSSAVVAAIAVTAISADMYKKDHTAAQVHRARADRAQLLLEFVTQECGVGCGLEAALPAQDPERLALDLRRRVVSLVIPHEQRMRGLAGPFSTGSSETPFRAVRRRHPHVAIV